MLGVLTVREPANERKGKVALVMSFKQLDLRLLFLTMYFTPPF